MDKDKQLQKIPKYSIDKIGAKSYLATRGLRELGLLKDEKHFTIIYVCQFCGRLINYSSTPCIFCGDYPKTKREVLVAQALSSNSLEMAHLLAISKAVKDKKDLEIIITNFRQSVDDILENENKLAFFQPLLPTTDDLATYKDRGDKFRKLSQIVCKQCGYKIYIAIKPCIKCGAETLSQIEKWIVAMNNFLLFTENHLSDADNIESANELIFVSVYIINCLIEDNDKNILFFPMPGNNIKNLWKDLLRKTNSFYARFGGEVVIGSENNDIKIEVFEGCTDNEQFIITAFGHNISYLLEF